MPLQFESTTGIITFRDAIRTYAPAWLSNYTGSRVLFTLGTQLDAFAEYLRIGCLQGFPTYAEEEALGYIGQDRKLLQGPAEPATAYRTRLKNFKSTWKYAGHPRIVLEQLGAYYQTVQAIRYVSSGYDDQNNQITEWWTWEQSTGESEYYRAPLNWLWDTEIGDYRFWLIVYKELLPLWYWDDGHTWDQSGLTWGYADAGEIYDARNIIETFKCAGSHLGGLIYVDINLLGFDPWTPTSPDVFPMPAGGWQDPNNRFSGAQYFFVPGD